MDLQGMLLALVGNDNASRSAAEKLYAEVSRREPAQTASFLAQHACASEGQVAVRSLACVLLRQLVRSKDWSQNVDVQTKRTVQNSAVAALEKESDANVGRKIVHVLVAFPPSELAELKTLVPDTFRLMENSPPEKVPLLMFLLSKVAEFQFALVQQHLEATAQVVSHYLKSGPTVECKLAASEALCSVMQSNPEPRKMQGFLEDAVPLMVEATMSGFQAQASPQAHDLAMKSMQALQGLTNKCIFAFDKSLGPVCLSLLQIVDCGDLDDETRTLSLNLFVELFTKRGKTISSDMGFMRNVMLLLLRLQCQDEEWTEDFESQTAMEGDMLLTSGGSLRGRALQAIATVAQNVSQPVAFTNELLSSLGSAIRSADWRERCAAISTIGAVAAALSGPLKPNLVAMMQQLEHLYKDADQRVVFVSLGALYELLDAEGLKGAFSQTDQPDLCRFVFCTLVGVLESQNACTPVVSAACLGLSSFLDPSHSNVNSIDTQTQERLLSVLANCIQTGALEVKEDALIALSAVAKVSGEGFGAFYDQLVPSLKQIISDPTCAMGSSQDAKSESKADALRASALSTVSAIANAVGKEKFRADANDILRLVFGSTDVNDQKQVERLSQLDGIFDFCKCVCEVLGAEFKPYLSSVLPLILFAIKSKPSLDVEDVIGDDVNSGEETTEDGQFKVVQEVRGKGTFRVTGNIFSFVARNRALDALGPIAETMGADFAEFLEPSFEVVIPAISETLNVEASVNAAYASGALIYATWKSLFKQGHSMEPGQKVLVTVLTTLLTALQAASDLSDDPLENDSLIDARAGLAAAVERCLRICWRSGSDHPDEAGEWPEPLLKVPAQVVPHMVGVLRDLLALSVQRRAQEGDRLAQEGYAEGDIADEMEEINECEEDFSSDLVDSIGYLLKLGGQEFAPVFEQALHPLASNLLLPSSPASTPATRFNAMCMYVDVIQYGGSAAAAKYTPLVLPTLIESVESDNSRLAQCACYGIGQAAKHATLQFVPRAGDAIQALLKIVSESKSKHLNRSSDDEAQSQEEDTELVFENAVSALGRIMEHCQSALAAKAPLVLENMMAAWFGALPLKVDQEEAQYTHRMLLQLIQQRSAHVEKNRDSVAKALGELLIRGVPSNTDSDSDDEEFQPMDKQTAAALHGGIAKEFFKSLAGQAQNQIIQQSSDPSTLQQLLAA